MLEFLIDTKNFIDGPPYFFLRSIENKKVKKFLIMTVYFSNSTEFSLVERKFIVENRTLDNYPMTFGG